MAVARSPAALLDELGITEPADIDVEAIAQHCGATVLYRPLHGCEARIIGVGSRACITVRNDVARPRQRFSVGHELGHWMRDRAVVAFSCTEQVFRAEWSVDNPERRANRYAAELLLPERMFTVEARPLPVTIESARTLARTFSTSLTATVIRLVELGPQPAMVVCTSRAGARRWFARSADVPFFPHPHVGRDSVAAELLRGATAPGPTEVAAATWIAHRDSDRYTVIEDSIPLGGEFVLSLLWWKDESQLIDAAGLGER